MMKAQPDNLSAWAFSAGRDAFNAAFPLDELSPAGRSSVLAKGWGKGKGGKSTSGKTQNKGKGGKK